MYRILRNKNGRRHFAARVLANGSIDGLVEDAIDAAVVDEALAAKVKAFHTIRPNVGELVFMPFTAADRAEVEAARAVAAESQRVRELQAVIELKDAEIVALKAQILPPAHDPTPKKSRDGGVPPAAKEKA